MLRQEWSVRLELKTLFWLEISLKKQRKLVNTFNLWAIMEMNQIPLRLERGSNMAMTEPLNNGRFGNFGGMFVPETLIPACQELEKHSEKHGDQRTFETS
ncbi:MAG: hypothetical protein CM15mP49_01970 [Actinomycetota bacterium]|nr:MAG: hypothetical protein CM15mP49_01970 [Actinomycetota bacterium]